MHQSVTYIRAVRAPLAVIPFDAVGSRQHLLSKIAIILQVSLAFYLHHVALQCFESIFCVCSFRG